MTYRQLQALGAAPRKKKRASRPRAKKRSSGGTRTGGKRKARKGRKAPKSKKKAKAKKVRMVTRYHPLTGQKLKVPADSTEAETWASRKPAKGRTPIGIAEKIAERAIQKSAPRIGRQVEQLAVKAAPAALLVGKAALAIAAGVAAYYGTTWLMNNLPTRPTLQDLDVKAAVAANRGRREAAQKLGRPLTPAELEHFGQKFKAALVENRKRIARGITMIGDVQH